MQSIAQEGPWTFLGKPKAIVSWGERIYCRSIIGIIIVCIKAALAKVRENFCNDDRYSAIKRARVYLIGLAKIVWQTDETTR